MDLKVVIWTKCIYRLKTVNRGYAVCATNRYSITLTCLVMNYYFYAERINVSSAT